MNPVLKQILQVGIPIAIANMSPVFFKGKHPIDFGKEWKGKRILGKGKTLEGLFGGIIVGTFAGFFTGNLLLALAVSAGALIGDIVESFFKRRIGIGSGKSWWGFDQTDFIIGGMIFGSFVELIMWQSAVILLLVFPFGHMLINYIGYKLKIKKNKF